MRSHVTLVEATQTVVLYHGTCQGHAAALLAHGWRPHSGTPGANQGQSRYLYLTTTPDNARWFAHEKGCDVVLQVTVPLQALRVDPEDGTGATVADELHRPHNLPGYLVLTAPISATAFTQIEPSPAR